MTDERQSLANALKAVTDRTPLITRVVINAMRQRRPLSWRQRELGIAISQSRALLDELMLQQVKLGWRERGDAA